MSAATRFEELRLGFAEAAGKYDGNHLMSIWREKETELILLRMHPVLYDIPCYVPFPSPPYRECAVLFRTSGDGEAPFNDLKRLAASAWHLLPLSLQRAVYQEADESFQVDGSSGYSCWTWLLWCDLLYRTDSIGSLSCEIDPFSRSAHLIEEWGLNVDSPHPPGWLQVEHPETGDGAGKDLETGGADSGDGGGGGARPQGFLGGKKLRDALGVHSTQSQAFEKKLGRTRAELGDENWVQVNNPIQNTPEYLYRADAQAVCDLAKSYTSPKPG